MTAIATPDEVKTLVHAACAFLGVSPGNVAPHVPGKFLEEALDAIEEDLSLAYDASQSDITDSASLATALWRAQHRLQSARKVAPLIDRELAREALDLLTESVTERRAALDLFAAELGEKRIAEIRAAFPGLTPTPEVTP